MIGTNNAKLIGLMIAVAVSIIRVSFADDSSLTPEVILEGLGVLDMGPHGEGNVYAPCFLADGGFLKKCGMRARARTGMIGFSTPSPQDGRTWDRKGVVLKDDSANHVNDPCVLKVDRRYFMFFTQVFNSS